MKGVNEPDNESELNKEEKKIDISKIPLNDTFMKADPDKFNNKLREANARYDEEHNLNVNNNAVDGSVSDGNSLNNSTANEYDGNQKVYEEDYEKEEIDEDHGDEEISEKFVEEIIEEPKRQPEIEEPIKKEVERQESISKTNGSNEEKVLIEKDGQFLYVDSDEYIAREKQKKLEEAQQLKILQKRPKSAHTTINGGSNVYTLTTSKVNGKNKISLELYVNSRDIKSADPGKRGREINKA